MKVMVVSDAHLFKTDDGRYWCNTAMHGYNFWLRYLFDFSEVVVVARVKRISIELAEKNNYIRADGNGVSVFDLPFVRGIKGYSSNMLKIRKACKDAAYCADSAVFRVPSIPAYMVLGEYKKLQKPYALEVVIDPEDEYSNYPVLRGLEVRKLKQECGFANGVSYVTQYYLQKKYPSGKSLGRTDKDYFESYYSSIDLKSEFFWAQRKYGLKNPKEISILHIANSINNNNKGHMTLINIASELKKRGINAKVTFIGNGDLIEYFKEKVHELNLDDSVVFTGYLSDKGMIRSYLKQADLFVFPTKAEGLPRVVIEAMATGLPVLSSNVDGIPELIDEQFLFAPDDVNGYVAKIIEIVSDESILRKMGTANYNRAMNYRSDILTQRRNEFYHKLYLDVKRSFGSQI